MGETAEPGWENEGGAQKTREEPHDPPKPEPHDELAQLERDKLEALLRLDIAKAKADREALVPPDEELEQEKRKELLRLDIAKAKVERSAVVAPWWRNGKWITALTAILAAVVPATTAVSGCYTQRLQVELATVEQTEKIRSSYLDRLKGDPIEGQRILRFLIETTLDDRMREWAKGENARIEPSVTKLKQDIDDATKRAEAAEAAADAKEGQLLAQERRLAENGSSLQIALSELQSARDEAQREKEKLAELTGRSRRVMTPSSDSLSPPPRSSPSDSDAPVCDQDQTIMPRIRIRGVCYYRCANGAVNTAPGAWLTCATVAQGRCRTSPNCSYAYDDPRLGL
jgi:hypothetical protein